MGLYDFWRLELNPTISDTTDFLGSASKFTVVIPHKSEFFGHWSTFSLMVSQIPKYQVILVCDGGVSFKDVTEWIPFKSSKLYGSNSLAEQSIANTVDTAASTPKILVCNIL